MEEYLRSILQTWEVSKQRIVWPYNFSLSHRWGITEMEGQRKGKLDDKGMFNGKSNGCTVQKFNMYLHICMCVVPPVVRSAEPLAVILWQLFEYYYRSAPYDLS